MVNAWNIRSKSPHIYEEPVRSIISHRYFSSTSPEILQLSQYFSQVIRAVCITISRPCNLCHANVETSSEFATLQYQWTCQNHLVCFITISHPCNLCHTNVETSSEFATVQYQWKYQSQSFKSAECICICIITIF